MGSWSVGSGTLGVVAASSQACGALGCGVGAEAPPVEGAAGVGARWGIGSGLDTGTGSGSEPLSDGSASSLCSPY